jgi:hypothetical protein
MAYDVCGVQPMTGPTGLIFAMRARYNAQDGGEALYQEANTAHAADAADSDVGAAENMRILVTIMLVLLHLQILMH